MLVDGSVGDCRPSASSLTPNANPRGRGLQGEVSQVIYRLACVTLPSELQGKKRTPVVIRYVVRCEIAIQKIVIRRPLADRSGPVSLELMIDSRYDRPPRPSLNALTKQLVSVPRHGVVGGGAKVDQPFQSAVGDRIRSPQGTANHVVGDCPYRIGIFGGAHYDKAPRIHRFRRLKS